MKKFILTTFILCTFYLWGQNSSTFGWSTTPKGNLHALVILIEYEEDANLTQSNWNYGEFPSFAQGDDNELLNKDPQNIGSHRNISKWFKDMSLGEFTITGEIFPEVIRLNREDNAGFHLGNGTIHQAAVDYINANYPVYDYSSFDSRSGNPN